MAHYYLTTFVGTGTYLPPVPPLEDATPDLFRPRGTDGIDGWHVLDLRPDGSQVAGRVFLASPVRNDVAIGGRYLGEAPTETMSAIAASRIGNDLGVTIESRRFDQVLAELLVEHARTDGSRWKPLRATRSSRLEIWLGDKLVDIVQPRGGATITESFNKADSSTLGPDLTWTEVIGDLTIVSNAVRNVTEGSTPIRARAEADLATADHYAQWATTFTVTGAGEVGDIGCCTRYAAGADTCYVGLGRESTAGGQEDKIEKVVAAAITILAAFAATTITTTLRVETEGSTTRLLWDGVQSRSVTDTEITGNLRTGIYMLAATNNESGDIIGDTFEAGDLAVAAAPPPQVFIRPSEAAHRAANW